MKFTQFHSEYPTLYARAFRVFYSVATMPTKTLGAVYMVESKYFAAGVLISYRTTLPDSEKSVEC
jgi:hypothetical protein